MSDALRFDPLLMSQVRLGVISVLVSRQSATFSDLRELLGLTQGNLTIHLPDCRCTLIDVPNRFQEQEHRRE